MPNVVKIKVTADSDIGSTASVIRGGLGKTGTDAANDFSSNFNKTLQSKTPPAVKVQAELDAAQLRSEAQEAADKAKAKVILDASLDKAQVLDEAERAAAEAKAQIKYTAQLDAADVKAKASAAAAEAKAQVKFSATVDQTSVQSAGEQAGQTISNAVKSKVSGGSEGGLGPLIAAGVLAGGPAVAAAGAVLGVAAIAGVGAALQHGSPAIQAAWTGLSTQAAATGQEASVALVTPLSEAMGKVTDLLRKEQPEFDELFQSAAADVPILTDGVDTLVKNALPGLDNALRNSQGAAQGFSAVMGAAGSLIGDVGTAIGNNSNKAGSALGMLAGDVSSLGAPLSGAISLLTSIGTGALPVFGGALRVAETDVTAILGALGPVAPALGAIGAASLTAFAGFKLAGAVSGGVTSLAGGILNLGTKVESTSPKFATLLGKTAATAESLAGPFGAAVVGGGVVLGVLASIMDKTTISSADLSNAQQTLTSTMSAGNGQLTSATTAALQQTDAYKTLVPLAQQAGISQSQLTQAIEGQGNALGDVHGKLNQVTADGVTYNTQGKVSTITTTAQAEASQSLSSGLDQLHTTYEAAVQAAKDQAAASKEAADAQQQANVQMLATTGLNFAGPAGTIASSLATIGDKASTDTQKVTALNAELQALVNPGGAAITTLAGISTAEQGLGTQLDGLKGKVADSNGNFDLTTAKGAAAASAIEGLSSQYTSYITQAKAAGTPTAAINANLQTQYDSLLKTVTGFTGSQAAAANYLSQLGVLPPTTETDAAFNDQQALAEISNLGGQIVGVPDGKTITATALTGSAVQTLQNLGYQVTHLPNGSFSVSANTSSAQAEIESAIRWAENQLVVLHVATAGAGSGTNLGRAVGGPVSAISGRAVGGAVSPLARNAAGGFGLTELDENGPEIVSLPNGSMVSPEANTNAKLQALQSRSGVTTVEIAVAPNAQGAVATMFRQLINAGDISLNVVNGKVRVS